MRVSVLLAVDCATIPTARDAAAASALDGDSIHLCGSDPVVQVAMLAEIVLSGVRRGGDRVGDGFVRNLVACAVAAFALLILGFGNVVRCYSIKRLRPITPCDHYCYGSATFEACPVQGLDTGQVGFAVWLRRRCQRYWRTCKTRGTSLHWSFRGCLDAARPLIRLLPSRGPLQVALERLTSHPESVGRPFESVREPVSKVRATF